MTMQRLEFDRQMEAFKKQQLKTLETQAELEQRAASQAQARGRQITSSFQRATPSTTPTTGLEQRAAARARGLLRQIRAAT